MSSSSLRAGLTLSKGPRAGRRAGSSARHRLRAASPAEGPRPGVLRPHRAGRRQKYFLALLHGAHPLPPGDVDRGFALLDKGMEDGDHWVEFIRSSPRSTASAQTALRRAPPSCASSRPEGDASGPPAMTFPGAGLRCSQKTRMLGHVHFIVPREIRPCQGKTAASCWPLLHRRRHGLQVEEAGRARRGQKEWYRYVSAFTSGTISRSRPSASFRRQRRGARPGFGLLEFSRDRRRGRVEEPRELVFHA